MSFCIRLVMVGFLFASPAFAMNLDQQGGQGTFLRTQGFEYNYGILADGDEMPAPPSFHLNLTIPTIIGETTTSSAESIASQYVFKTVERVFAQMIGDEPANPYQTPSYRLIGETPQSSLWDRPAH